jgi:hypothetical protein
MPPLPNNVLPEDIAFVEANRQKIEKLLADYKNWNEPKNRRPAVARPENRKPLGLFNERLCVA